MTESELQNNESKAQNDKIYVKIATIFGPSNSLLDVLNIRFFCNYRKNKKIKNVFTKFFFMLK